MWPGIIIAMLRVLRQLSVVLIKITSCALQVPGSNFFNWFFGRHLCSFNLYNYIHRQYILAGLKATILGDAAAGAGCY